MFGRPLRGKSPLRCDQLACPSPSIPSTFIPCARSAAARFCAVVVLPVPPFPPPTNMIRAAILPDSFPCALRASVATDTFLLYLFFLKLSSFFILSSHLLSPPVINRDR